MLIQCSDLFLIKKYPNEKENINTALCLHYMGDAYNARHKQYQDAIKCYTDALTMISTATNIDKDTSSLFDTIYIKIANLYFIDADRNGFVKGFLAAIIFSFLIQLFVYKFKPGWFNDKAG